MDTAHLTIGGLKMHFSPEQLKVYFIAGSQNTNHDVDELISIVENACQNGITMFQYREKDSSTLPFANKVAVAQKLKTITNQYGVPFIIDDDIELMRAVNADGIHVGQDDTKIEQVISTCSDKIIGLSTHDQNEVSAANKIDGLDYIGIGPIFATNSKAHVKEAIGIDSLVQLYALANHPAVAIGGIHLNNVHDVLSTDVDGISVISAITKTNNFAKTISTLKGEL